ncbi:MAG: 2-amino-4-hydroxy-6-hydroxymethyldihydropteridine diphosphokinase [Rhizobiaceae bacterium]
MPRSVSPIPKIMTERQTSLARQAWLGLGGNIGNVKANMAVALQLLSAGQAVEILSVSPIYKTPPWGNVDQDWFLNAVAKISTKLSPELLLEACLSAEKALKRERIVRWGPRSIDVDLLIYEGVEQANDTLTLPHPRMHERAFVLKPLADISPELLIYRKSVSDWLGECDTKEIELYSAQSNWHLARDER